MSSTNMPMSTYEKVSLGEEARAYIQRSLRAGLTLGGLIARRINLAEGDVFAFLPQDVDHRAFSEFRYGGIARHASAAARVEERIREFSGRQPPALFVAENAVAACTDPLVQKYATSTFCYRGEVYHWLELKEVEPQDVLATMRMANSGWLLNCLVSSLASPGDPRFALTNCTITTLDVLADRTELVVVRAYDGEGYVVWQGPSPATAP